MPAWIELPLLGFDTETTGLSVTEDRIFEIALITYKDGQVVEQWSKKLDPMRPLPPEVTRMTGISDVDLQGQPPFQLIAQDVMDRLNGQVIVGYNILDFDLPLLEAEFKRVGLSLPKCYPVDVLIFARELQRGGRHNLSEMMKNYGLVMETAHRAGADADASVRLLMAMASDLPRDLVDLLRLQTQWRDSQRARKATWRQRSDGPALLRQEVGASAGFIDEQGRVSLGPKYLYGNETDPLRSFLITYCDATSHATVEERGGAEDE